MKDNNLLGLDRTQLAACVEALGEPRYRGLQLYRQLYSRRQFDLNRMTDLGLPLRARLTAGYVVRLPTVVRRQDSVDGTVKLLLGLEDERHVEAVYIPDEDRQTLCISSQVGCDVGCTFCMTAQMGFFRNLRPGEIVGQVLEAVRAGLLPPAGFNVVFMGMGEPLYNYRNVMAAFRLLTDPEGIGLSARRITLSTSGVVPVLKKLAAESSVPNLAISLNATTDEDRTRIMPINAKWGLADLLDACREFPLRRRRRITFEYVLLHGETDSAGDADRLAGLLRGLRAKVNLIPFNANPELPHVRPGALQVDRFRRRLVEAGVDAYVRRSRGLDISAACGQLAHADTGSEATRDD